MSDTSAAGPSDAPLPAPRQSLGRAGAIMASGTLVSRVVGLVRAALLAGVIGTTGYAADAFTAANTLPNSFYLLIAGGTLNAILVPQIVRARLRPDGDDFVNRIITISLVILAVATVLLTALAPVIVPIYYDVDNAEALALATVFAVICLPQIFFYGLYTILGQVLNAHGRFAGYMWAPALANVVAVAGLLWFMAAGFPERAAPADWTPEMVAVLAGSATLSIVAQALCLVVPLRRIGFRYRPVWGLRGYGLGEVSNVAKWTFASIVVSQLGFVVTSRVLTRATRLGEASGEPVAGLAAFNPALLIVMLPHGLVTVSLVTALYTRLSEAASREDHGEVLRYHRQGLRDAVGHPRARHRAHRRPRAVRRLHLLLHQHARGDARHRAGARRPGLDGPAHGLDVPQRPGVLRAPDDVDDVPTPVRDDRPRDGRCPGGLQPRPEPHGVRAEPRPVDGVRRRGGRGLLGAAPPARPPRAARRRIDVPQAARSLGPHGPGPALAHPRGVPRSRGDARHRGAGLGRARPGGRGPGPARRDLVGGDCPGRRRGGRRPRAGEASTRAALSLQCLRWAHTRSAAGAGAPARREGRSKGATVRGVGPGTVLGGRYTVHRRLEQLHGVERWSADDTTLGRSVSILCIAADDHRTPVILDAARRAASVTHVVFVRILDVGTDDDVAYVVEEDLGDSRTLGSLVIDGGVPGDEVRRITGEVASALESARQRGMHHLDLTPDDVLRTSDGDIRLRGRRGSSPRRPGRRRGGGGSSSRRGGRRRAAYAGLTGLWPLGAGGAGLGAAPRVPGGVAVPSEIAAGVPRDLDAICGLTLNDDQGPTSPGDYARQVAPWPSRQVVGRPVTRTASPPVVAARVPETLEQPASDRTAGDPSPTGDEATWWAGEAPRVAGGAAAGGERGGASAGASNLAAIAGRAASPDPVAAAAETTAWPASIHGAVAEPPPVDVPGREATRVLPLPPGVGLAAKPIRPRGRGCGAGAPGRLGRRAVGRAFRTSGAGHRPGHRENDVGSRSRRNGAAAAGAGAAGGAMAGALSGVGERVGGLARRAVDKVSRKLGPDSTAGAGLEGLDYPAPLVPAEPLTKDESRLALGIVAGFLILALIIGIWGMSRIGGNSDFSLGGPPTRAATATAQDHPPPARRPSPSAGQPAASPEPLAILKVEAYDPEGDGEENNRLGIFALYALVRRYKAAWVIYPAMIGCCTLVADGFITPAISVSSAVEGLRLIYPNIPTTSIVIVILMLLFVFQQFGSAIVGRTFGPIMSIWFLMLAILGGSQLIQNPAILKAINPAYALYILTHYPQGFLLLRRFSLYHGCRSTLFRSWSLRKRKHPHELGVCKDLPAAKLLWPGRVAIDA